MPSLLNVMTVHAFRGNIYVVPNILVYTSNSSIMMYYKVLL